MLLKRRADDMPGKPMEMEGVQGVQMRLMIGRDDGAPNFSLRHFTVAPGGQTPRHSHNYEHEVVILEGNGQLEYDGDHHPIAAGDVLFVEPNKVHQFRNAGDTPMKFMCLVPTMFDCGADGSQPTPGS